MEPGRLAVARVFAGLSAADLQALAAVTTEREVAPGELVVAQGDFGHALFVIESGEAEVTVDGVPVATLGCGDVFGEIALLASGRRTASVTAISPLRLLAIFKRDVWRLETAAPRAAERVRSLISERREGPPA
jgi:CRP-like cAMP-binding protein